MDADFARRVARSEREVRRGVSHQPLDQAQFDALVSLAYNAGARGSRGTWQLVEKGDMSGAAINIKKMTKTTINGKLVVASGLMSRRAEEAAPFLTGSVKK